MAFPLYTLLVDAEFIRDTNVWQSNTAEFVGKWCEDCTRYIKGPAALNALAVQVRTETAALQNSATRLGTWCYDALQFVGIRAGDGKQATYDDLYLRSIEIRDEYREQLNERRLGRWFYDFLFYIDYEGDTTLEKFFIFNVSMTSSARTFSLPVYNTNTSVTPEIAVDWGDGTFQNVQVRNQTGGILHNYARAGNYQIMFLSTTEVSFTSLQFSLLDSSRKQGLIGIENFGVAPNMATVNFSGCSNLNYINPDQTFEGFSSVTSIDSCFRNCTNLAEIPANIFSHLPNDTRIAASYCFAGTRALLSVPDGIFSRISDVNSITGLFQNSGIQSIPSNFFSGILGTGTNISASYCFDASQLSTIGADFFRPIGNGLTSIAFAFRGCTQLTSIPETIFQANTGITDASFCFSRSALQAIPTSLFTNSIAISNFSSTFSYTSITAIPPNLFATNTAVATFTSCFSNCINLTSIPYQLFENNIRVTDYSFVFSNTTSLTSVDVRLFSNATVTTNFQSCFASSGLLSVPSGLFANCAAARDFTSVFSDCYSLTTISGPPFPTADLAAGRDLTYAFRNTTSLRTLPDNLFMYCGDVTLLYGAFYGSAIDTPQANVFNGMSRVASIQYLFRNCPNVDRVRKSWFDSFSPSITSLTGVFRYDSDQDVPKSPFYIEYGVFSNFASNITDVNECLYGARTIMDGENNAIRDLFTGFTSLRGANELWSYVQNFSFNWYQTSSTPFPGTYSYMFPDSANSVRNIYGIFRGANIYDTAISDNSSVVATPHPLLNLTRLIRADYALAGSKIMGVPYMGSFVYYVPALIAQSNEPSIAAYNYMDGAIAEGGETTAGFNIPANIMPAGVTSMQFAFSNLVNAVGRTPNQSNQVAGEVELWNRAGTTGYPARVTGTQCFRGSTGFTNYADIPDDWK